MLSRRPDVRRGLDPAGVADADRHRSRLARQRRRSARQGHGGGRLDRPDLHDRRLHGRVRRRLGHELRLARAARPRRERRDDDVLRHRHGRRRQRVGVLADPDLLRRGLDAAVRAVGDRHDPGVAVERRQSARRAAPRRPAARSRSTRTRPAPAPPLRAAARPATRPRASRRRWPTDGTTTFYTTATDAAGNESACSAAASTYVEDTVAPPAPTMAGSQPGSPSPDNNPRIRGGAESGSTVRLYTDAGCSGAIAAEGSAADFADPRPARGRRR